VETVVAWQGERLGKVGWPRGLTAPGVLSLLGERVVTNHGPVWRGLFAYFNVPRIILLILKTNDLTRSLDELLGSKQPMRPMMILAEFASITVWEEEEEKIRQRGELLNPRNLLPLLRAWSSHMRTELKFFGYDRYLSLRRHLHLD